MNRLAETGTPGTLGEHPDSRRELAQRVAASRPFVRSVRMQRFLLYICERALSGRTDELIEQVIGTAVFERKPDYSPSDDNIVRVEARNLRKRLQEYFDGDGREEPIVITVPKGGYVPVFEERAVAVAPEAPALARQAPRPSRIWWGVTAVLALLTIALVVGEFRRPSADQGPIWPAMLDPSQQTVIVLADSNFALYQDLKRQDLSLEDYIGGKYIGRETDPTYSTVARRQYTSLADATLAARLAHGVAAMRFARSLQVRDFHNGNAILLGSRRSNPWVELFEPKLNFTVVYDPHTAQAYYIRNKSPRSGESSRYVMESNDIRAGRAYGLISLVPNLSGNGRVLMLQGLNMEATEAVGQFLLSPGRLEKLRQAIGADDAGALPPFEVLVKVNAIGGAASETEIIAARRSEIR